MNNGTDIFKTDISINDVMGLIYVCPCIIYENDERYQLDATLLIYYHKYLYMFLASICPSSGVRVVYNCIWCPALGVVAEALRSRCVVLCTVCEFVSDVCMYDGYWWQSP